MKIGDYIIVNEWDCPCTRLINKIISINEQEGIFQSIYICENTSVITFQGLLSEATLISDFGVEIIFFHKFDSTSENKISCYVTSKKLKDSIVTYKKGGGRRDWQQPFMYDEDYMNDYSSNRQKLRDLNKYLKGNF